MGIILFHLSRIQKDEHVRIKHISDQVKVSSIIFCPPSNYRADGGSTGKNYLSFQQNLMWIIWSVNGW